MRLMILLIVVLAGSAQAFADPGLRGHYAVESESEWGQELFLLEGGSCFLMTENWMPGEYEERDIVYHACVWTGEGGRVTLQCDGVSDILLPGVWNRDDGNSGFGLKSEKSGNPASRMTGHVFWRVE